MSLRAAIWWFSYFIIAIWLQKFIPGLDALAAGLVLCLQSGSKQKVALYLLICVVIQEGSGTLPFGSSILWYSYVILLYFLGVWFFMAQNFFFIGMLAIGMGVGRVLLIASMDMLQSIPFDNRQLLQEGILQAVITPVLWYFAARSTGWIEKNAH